MPDNEDTRKVPEETSGKREPKAIKMNLIACIIIVVLIGIIAIMGYKLLMKHNPNIINMQGDQVIPSSGMGIVVTEDTKNTLQEIQEKVAKGSIAVKMTQGWVFGDGGKTSNAYLANSERNSYDMRFQISLTDTGEVIMVSPDVPVGSCIENFPLAVTLEPGNYDIIIDHQLVEDGEVFATVKTAAEISVN